MKMWLMMIKGVKSVFGKRVHGFEKPLSEVDMISAGFSDEKWGFFKAFCGYSRWIESSGKVMKIYKKKDITCKRCRRKLGLIDSIEQMKIDLEKELLNFKR